MMENANIDSIGNYTCVSRDKFCEILRPWPPQTLNEFSLNCFTIDQASKTTKFNNVIMAHPPLFDADELITYISIT